MTTRVPALYEGRDSAPAKLIREEPVQPRASAGAAYIGMVEFFRILKRRRRLVVGTILSVMLLTLLALTQMTPIYSSSAVMMIEPSEGAVPTDAVTALTVKPDEELRIATKMELLQSRSLARKVARNMRLIEDPEFAPKEDKPGLVARALSWISPTLPKESTYADEMSADELNQAVEQAKMEAVTDRLISKLNVERVAKSHLISVTASSSDPYKASLIANRIVEQHIKGQMNELQQAHSEDIEQLAQRVEELRNKLKVADSAVSEYRRSNNLFASRTEQMNTSMLTQLEGALAQARAASAQNSARAAGLTGSAAALAQSPLLNDLKNQEAALAKKVAELSSLYGRGHPEMISANAQLDEIRQRLAAETVRAQATVGAQAAVDRNASGASVGVIQGAIGQLRATNNREMAATAGLKDLERDADTSNALYVSLLAQLKEASGKSAGARPDAKIISRAPVPDAPSHPEVKRTLAIALIAALMLAVILAFVAESLDNRIRTATQVDHLLGLPTLAMVPDVSAITQYSPAHALVKDQPRSAFSEAVRNLYIELLARSDRPGSKVVVVTSPLANEGKTTVATSLAAAATTLNHSAVVLDVDLRQPAMAHALLGTSTDADVIAYLNDRAVLDELLQSEDQPEQFFQIGAHEPAQDPSALISSPRLAKLISQLRERFDLVVLNAPPILPVRDAKILASYADAALLVLRWGKTHPDAARVAMEIFGDKLTGAVLNRVDYPEHARRNYGDAIHYYAESSSYPEGAEGARPAWRIFDRAFGRPAGNSDGRA